MIISASRRTDIPSFYGNWLMERMKEGNVLVKNPYNPNQQKKISLQKQDVDCFVFWTKNALPFMDPLQRIHKKGYPFYVLYTITPYGLDLEENLPQKRLLIENFKQIIELYGRGSAIWRYDPIILTKKYNISYHLKAFSKLADLLEGYTHVCLISFLEYYRKLRKRNWPEGFNPSPNDSLKMPLVGEMNKIAGSHNIQLAACCNSLDGIPQPGCINHEFVQQISPGQQSFQQDKHQRKNCRCIKSVDIGSYGTCKHGCLYCYAC
jgi:hypothetical protein